MKMMKTPAFLIVLLAFLASCDGFLDINTDPNRPTVAPVSGLMANATYQTSINHYNTGSVTSYFVQYLASPNPASSTDIHEEVSYGTAWSNIYDVMTDLSDLEILAEAQGATDYVGVAHILKAINLGMAVDMWGDLPYSEAFFGETLSPKFDTASDLYPEIQRLLDKGIAELGKSNSSISIGRDDYIHRGDKQKWLRTAHMLKARYLNHFSKQSSYSPALILAAIDQGFTSNSDDAQMIFFNERINPWAQVAINNDNRLLDGWISSQFVEATNGVSYEAVDPRLPRMIGTTNDGLFVGTANGAGRGDAPELGARSTIHLETYYATRTSPLFIATFAEQKFIEAEAAFRSGNKTRAYAAYLDGIRAHMDKIGVDAAARDAYMAHSEVAPGESSFTLDHIFKEKYVAMFLHHEAWVDARRFDYGYKNMTLPANHNPVLGGQFIRRVAYPSTETTRNRENVPVVRLSDRLVWDQ